MPKSSSAFADALQSFISEPSNESVIRFATGVAFDAVTGDDNGELIASTMLSVLTLPTKLNQLDVCLNELQQLGRDTPAIRDFVNKLVTLDVATMSLKTTLQWGGGTSNSTGAGKPKQTPHPDTEHDEDGEETTEQFQQRKHDIDARLQTAVLGLRDNVRVQVGQLRTQLAPGPASTEILGKLTHALNEMKVHAQHFAVNTVCSVVPNGDKLRPALEAALSPPASSKLDISATILDCLQQLQELTEEPDDALLVVSPEHLASELKRHVDDADNIIHLVFTDSSFVENFAKQLAKKSGLPIKGTMFDFLPTLAKAPGFAIKLAWKVVLGTFQISAADRLEQEVREVIHDRVVPVMERSAAFGTNIWLILCGILFTLEALQMTTLVPSANSRVSLLK